MIHIVNKRTHKPTPFDVPIHRGTPLGNPWTHIQGKTKALYVCPTRDASIEHYKEWFHDEIEDGRKEILDELRRIYRMAVVGDVYLVCYCAPLHCHGEIIKDFIESHIKNETTRDRK